MQPLKVITARSVWLLPLTDMNPQGKAIDTVLIDWLKRTYHFQKYPSSAFDLDSETKALVFLGGKFKSRHEEDGKERYLAVALTVYNDGLVANTESSTSDTDEFLEGLIQSAVTEFGLVHPGIRKKLYFSEMDVRLDRPIRLINPRLQQLASRISELRGDTIR